jgi:hypothetical protein
MVSDPNVLNDAHRSYISISDPEEDNGSEVLSFDEDDMFELVDNPDEIVVTCPDSDDNSDTQPSFDNVSLADLDSDGDGQASVDDVISLNRDFDDKAQTSLHDVILPYLDSEHDSKTRSAGLVCH